MGLTAQFGTVVKEVRAADCSVAEQIGDLVYISGGQQHGRDQVRKVDPTDYSKMPAAGVIIAKPTTTTCRVQWMGETPQIFSGLLPGRPFFVGRNGRITHTPPQATGSSVYIQAIGEALSESKAYLRVDGSLTLRHP